MRDLRAGREKGQSIAELALVLPLLILILLGCTDFGRAFAAWITLCNGTREGARYGADHPGMVEQAEAWTEFYIVGEGLSEDALEVGALVPTEAGEPVVVTATYDLPLVSFMLFGGQPVRISSRTEMLVLPGEL